MVQGSLAGRLHLRRDAAARPIGRGAVGRRAVSGSAVSRSVVGRSAVVPVRISIGSMRILETGLALSAIATALLIGHH
jgi:hypothetical protein